ncbi:MAG: STAS domain-containing protein [Victivallales bacterium]
MAERLQIIEEKRKGVNILRIRNTVLLEPQAADEMTKILSDAFDSGSLKVIINIANVTRMSSLFFRSFIIAGKKAKEKNAVMIFCNVSPTIKAGFDMMGLGAYFKIYPEESNALDNI